MILKLKKTFKFFLILTIFALASCESLDIVPNETDLYKEKMEDKGRAPRSATPIIDFFPDIFGDSGVNFGSSITYEVALKKFSAMPIITADMSNGIITTDWYSTSSNSNERFKFNIIIKDDEMTNESIIINMFKEKIDGGLWKTTSVNLETGEKIRQSILKQSKKLKATAEMS